MPRSHGLLGLVRVERISNVVVLHSKPADAVAFQLGRVKEAFTSTELAPVARELLVRREDVERAIASSTRVAPDVRERARAQATAFFAQLATMASSER